MNVQDVQSRKAIKDLLLVITSILDIQLALFKLVIPASPEMSSVEKKNLQAMIESTVSTLTLLRQNLETSLPS
jgi:hypothetical protein